MSQCMDYKHFEPAEHGGPWGKCDWTPPATIAKRMGLDNQFDLESAKTHEDWTCSVFEDVDP